MADPDIDDQVISPRRALGELGRIRRVTLTVADRTIERDTRHSALQDRILGAFGVEAGRLGAIFRRLTSNRRKSTECRDKQPQRAPSHLRFRDRGVKVG